MNSSAFLPKEQHPAAVRTAVSHAEMEVWSACDIFAQKWYRSCIRVLAPTKCSLIFCSQTQGFSVSSVGILDAIRSSKVFHSEAGIALRSTDSSKGLFSSDVMILRVSHSVFGGVSVSF